MRTKNRKKPCNEYNLYSASPLWNRMLKALRIWLISNTHGSISNYAQVPEKIVDLVNMMIRPVIRLVILVLLDFLDWRCAKKNNFVRYLYHTPLCFIWQLENADQKLWQYCKYSAKQRKTTAVLGGDSCFSVVSIDLEQNRLPIV